MAFGIDTGISRNRNCTVQVAERANAQGDIDDMHSYGGKEEKTEEIYSNTFTNTAVNGQGGTTVISAHSYIEANDAYARTSKTTMIALSVATTTT